MMRRRRVLTHSIHTPALLSSQHPHTCPSLLTASTHLPLPPHSIHTPAPPSSQHPHTCPSLLTASTHLPLPPHSIHTPAPPSSQHPHTCPSLFTASTHLPLPLHSIHTPAPPSSQTTTFPPCRVLLVSSTRRRQDSSASTRTYTRPSLEGMALVLEGSPWEFPSVSLFTCHFTFTSGSFNTTFMT